MSNFSRRALLASALALGATRMGLSSAQAEATRLRLYWWGNPERDKRTKAAVDAYLKRDANLQIASESLPWGEYWTKLGTQTAGGNAPDLIQMDYRYIAEYARREAILPLDGLKSLDLSGFAKSSVDGGKVDGKLYGVDLGGNSKAMIYDTAAFEKVGVKSVEGQLSWDEFTRIGAEISKVNPGKFWGTGDNSRWEQGYEQWLNMRGKLLYTPDGKLAFTADDAGEWYSAWDKLRKAGICCPAEIAAGNNAAVDQYEVSKGLAAMSYLNSNQLVAMQSLNKNKLSMTMFPKVKDGSSGHYIKPSQLMSISAKTKYPEEAAKFISYLVNDPEGVKLLGLERGIPESSKSKAILLPDLDDLGKLSVAYVDEVTKVAVALPPPAPKGAGEIDQLMRKMGDAVAFGKLSVSEGAKQLVSEANDILARA